MRYKTLLTFVSAVMVFTALAGNVVRAHDAGGNIPAHVHLENQRVVTGERYTPGIWVDPDGCEHWVMDDGLEGYMTPKVDRNGIPSCKRANICGTIAADTLFATNRYDIGPAARQQLIQFFQNANGSGFIIIGHTDARASDAYNMRLSQNRANAVARVAQAAGRSVYNTYGMGERKPIATNSTREGMARNRRVEILCVQ